MGTLYYAVGKTNRQAIELGKGWWDDPFKDKVFTFESMVEMLTEHFSSDYYSVSLQEKEYIERVAHKLLSIDTAFELVCESASSERYEGIKIVASRYNDTKAIGEMLSDHLN